MHRVMITGLGIVCPAGVGRDAFWRNLITGRSGVGPISLFDASSFPVRIAGEVKELDAAAIREKYPQAANTRDRKVLLALQAAEEAVGDAGLAKRDMENAALCHGVGLEAFFLEDLTPCVHRPDFAQALAVFLLRENPQQNMQTPLDCAGGYWARTSGFAPEDTSIARLARLGRRRSAKPGRSSAKARQAWHWPGPPTA